MAIARLVEVVLTVADMQHSLAFYRDLLGLEVFSPDKLPAKFLRLGPPEQGQGIPQQIVLVPAPPGAAPPTGRKLHHLGLAVTPEDFPKLRQQLIDHGFDVRTGEHPFMPVDAFYVDDPDGNEVEIATWRGAS